MNKIVLYLIFLSVFISKIYTQTGALIYETGNPTINESAILEVISSDKGILIPRMTTLQRDAITIDADKNGLIISLFPPILWIP
jgi:hypothetical protein